MLRSSTAGTLARVQRASWRLSEGDELAPGRWIVRLLGGGSRYEAFLAYDEHLRALLVAKVLRPDQLDDEGARHGIAGEAELLRRLAHPMLLRGFGEALDAERPHLVLEFVEGPRLSTLVRRYGLDIEQLLPLALNLCSALHYLGREGVVHLDVKPRNIIMGAEPRLIDLSVARPIERLGELRAAVGTVGYMAPEQRDPARFDELGPAADVWGLGATLHAVLTGAPPLTEPFPSRVPDAVADVVRACLEPRPGDRPAAGEVADVLEPLVDGLAGPRIGRFRPRRSARAA